MDHLPPKKLVERINWSKSQLRPDTVKWNTPDTDKSISTSDTASTLFAVTAGAVPVASRSYRSISCDCKDKCELGSIFEKAHTYRPTYWREIYRDSYACRFSGPLY